MTEYWVRIKKFHTGMWWDERPPEARKFKVYATTADEARRAAIHIITDDYNAWDLTSVTHCLYADEDN